MRPERTTLSAHSLDLIGIPKSLHHVTMDDFIAYDEALNEVRNYITHYLNTLPEMFEANKGLFLYGSNGVGKTYIACMIAKEAYRRRYTARRVTFIEYVSAYTRMWGAHTPDEKEYLEQEFYNSYKAVEFLVLEEVGKEIDSKISAPILEDCLRYREDRGLVTIICTNLDFSKVKERYGISIASLIQGNMSPLKIAGEDKRREFFTKRRGGKK